MQIVLPYLTTINRDVARTNFGWFTTFLGGSGGMLPQKNFDICDSMSLILVNFWIKFMSSGIDIIEYLWFGYRTEHHIAASKRPKV